MAYSLKHAYELGHKVYEYTSTISETKTKQQPPNQSPPSSPVQIWFFSLSAIQSTITNNCLITDWSQRLNDLINKFYHLDHLTSEYYRKDILLEIARDSYQALPNTYDPAQLDLPSSRIMLECIIYKKFCDACGFSDYFTGSSSITTATEQPITTPPVNSSSIDFQNILNKVFETCLLHYQQFWKPRLAWCRQLRKWYREGVFAPIIVERLNEQCGFPWLELAFQDLIVQYVLNDPLACQYQGSDDEIKLFWNTLNKTIERGGYEVHEGIINKVMSLLMNNMQFNMSQNERPAYRSFEFPKCFPSSSLPSNSNSDHDNAGGIGETEGTEVVTLCVSEGYENNVGLKNWPGGFRMAEYILSCPEFFQNKRCLELGAGVGLTASILARSGAKPKAIIATDYDIDTLVNLKANLDLNELESKFGDGYLKDLDPRRNTTTTSQLTTSEGDDEKKCEYIVDKLDWLNVTDEQLSVYQAQVIFTCDTIYLPECLDALCEVLKRLLILAQNWTEEPLLLSMQAVRNEEIFGQFLELLTKHGLIYTEVSLAQEKVPTLFEYDTRMFYRVVLHQITLAGPSGAS